ncbi:replication endonuclease [Vibrio kagoshimensis]|uniref:replication endonuclease n=1 Tax=Vibrio kagoshimensis TaxID=2910244 RepID=UPI003D1CF66F
MDHLYSPQVEPARHFSAPRLPVPNKRFVSTVKHVTKPRLSAFGEYIESFNLPERYRQSKLNILTNWRDDVFRACFRHGDFSRHMTRSFHSVCDDKNYTEALHQIEDANKRLNQYGYSAAMSDDEIKELAFSKSRKFTKELIGIESPQFLFMKACQLLDSIGLEFSDELIIDKCLKGELLSLVERVSDEIFLRRQLRRKCAYHVEQVARDLALVQRHKQVYCSDFSVNRTRERRASNAEALEQTVAYDSNDTDNWFTIADLAAKSVSNPEIRRGEMFVRLRGFEEIAAEQNHSSVFYTVTSPSRFHANSKGSVNPKWLEAGKPTAKQTHQYLLENWQKLGRWLSKHDIKVYGMRIAEPHQDGTPHHHFLLFMESKDRDRVTKKFNSICMVDCPNEKGADKYRFKAENIDLSKGSAVGYVAKYLSKNIDGQHIDKDKGSNLNGIEAAERVVTWARVNQIRQFQFIGGPSVSVWREFRRLREEFKEDDAVLSDLDETEHYMLEKIRKAADVGDWKDFCFAMGGVMVKRQSQNVRLQYGAPEAVQKLLLEETGHDGQEYTRFGDKAPARVSGLLFKEVYLCTRFRNWKVENKEKFLASQQTIMRGVTDFFDALEAEQEYERMADKRFQEYEAHMEYVEELEAMMLFGDFNGVCSVGAAPPDTYH